MSHYHLFPTSRNPASADPLWLTEARYSLLCKGCGSVPTTGRFIDMVVQRVPDESALNTIYGLGLCFAMTSFLKALDPKEERRLFRTGRLLNPERVEIFLRGDIYVSKESSRAGQ